MNQVNEVNEMTPEKTPESPPPIQTRFLPLPLTRPVVTYVILAVNVLVFLAMELSGGSQSTQILIRFGAKVNPLIIQGETWRLFTSMFLHIGLMHLAFNSYALFVIGVEMERLYGNRRFSFIYLYAGVAGALASFIFSSAISAGASGAIFGLIGTLVAFFLRHKGSLGRFGRERLSSLLIVVVYNLIIGVSMPGIDNFAHLGGLLSGFILGWFLSPQYEVSYTHELTPYLKDKVTIINRLWAIVLALALLAGGAYLAIHAQAMDAGGLLLLGKQAASRGDMVQAEDYFRQSLRLDSRQPEAYFMLGVVLAKDGKNDEAVLAYQRALQLQPQLPEAHWNLALAYAGLGQNQQAIQEMRQFMAMSSDDASRREAADYIQSLQKP